MRLHTSGPLAYRGFGFQGERDRGVRGGPTVGTNPPRGARKDCEKRQGSFCHHVNQERKPGFCFLEFAIADGESASATEQAALCGMARVAWGAGGCSPGSPQPATPTPSDQIRGACPGGAPVVPQPGPAWLTYHPPTPLSASSP